MPKPITPAPVNSVVGVASTSQADPAGQLAGKTPRQGQPGAPRAQDRLAALGQVTSHVTAHLQRSEVAALASTSGVVRRAVLADPKNARMLDASRQLYEFKGPDPGHPDHPESLYAQAEKADEARFGRVHAAPDELKKPFWAGVEICSELLSKSWPPSGGDAIASLHEIVERLSTQLNILGALGQDVRDELEWMLRKANGTDGSVEAVLKVLDDAKRLGPIEARPLFRDVEQALLAARYPKIYELVATGRASCTVDELSRLLAGYEDFNNLIESLIDIDVDVNTRIDKARRIFPSANLIIERMAGKGIDVLFDADRYDLLFEVFESRVSELKQAGPPKILEGIVAQMDKAMVARHDSRAVNLSGSEDGL